MDFWSLDLLEAIQGIAFSAIMCALYLNFTVSNWFKLDQICLNLIQIDQTCSKLFKVVQTPSKLRGILSLSNCNFMTSKLFFVRCVVNWEWIKKSLRIIMLQPQEKNAILWQKLFHTAKGILERFGIQTSSSVVKKVCIPEFKANFVILWHLHCLVFHLKNYWS